MRTESNTVLPLSSSVSNKSAKVASVSAGNGAAFERDFNEAKVDRDPKKVAELERSQEASVVEPEASFESRSKELRNHGGVSSSVTDRVEGAQENTSEASDDSISDLVPSGNVLQPNGDQLPVSGTDAEFIDEGSLLSSAASDNTIQNSANGFVDVGELTQFPQGEAGAMYMASDDSFQSDLTSGVVDEDTLFTRSDTQFQPNLKVNSKASLVNSSLVDVNKMSSGLAENSSGPAFLESDSESQLSWVLSQMDVSANKAAVMSPEALTMDNTKAGIAATGLLSASINKGAGSNLTLSSTLDSVGMNFTEVAEDSFLNEDIVLGEPVELGEKEQEAIIARMSTQINGRLGDENVGGLNSSLQSNGINRLVPGMNLSAVPVNNPQSNLAMSLPPTHPGWAGEMSQKVAWVAREGGHTAHIRLDPPELGSLTVKISVDNDANTQVSFLAATPQARDLLESQMNRLRDMLAQQGMDLSKADVDVSQQDASGTQREMERDTQNRNDIASEEVGGELVSSNLSYVSASGVDYYA
ncbi:hypothetical protein MUS1_13040 [Marinomonas ushuaiensis DSM 15871]|uniref:Flagellar hook-length control protein-like C-terminal domain-containing protein n=1 Tax=Marinomonas ushuaiensis DSM 15871 TaxID=1122207 RepID=X7E6Z7_9GAMM|nr:flagellar hook-length control protein FliK [Marinomonas ushuaiensis]ETX10898.1 hypothetical protein MUS1_13040 [Marinomonas ushuaiensis DSM 15871]